MENIMSLSLVFRIGAVWLGFWTILLWFAPEQFAIGNGWELTPNLKTLMQGLGLAAASLVALHLSVARWGGSNMSSFGIVAGVMWTLSTLLNGYQISIGDIELNGITIFGLVVSAIISLLFFLRSKA
jgi:hypothetical protein